MILPHQNIKKIYIYLLTYLYILLFRICFRLLSTRCYRCHVVFCTDEQQQQQWFCGKDFKTWLFIVVMFPSLHLRITWLKFSMLSPHLVHINESDFFSYILYYSTSVIKNSMLYKNNLVFNIIVILLNLLNFVCVFT